MDNLSLLSCIVDQPFFRLKCGLNHIVISVVAKSCDSILASISEILLVSTPSSIPPSATNRQESPSTLTRPAFYDLAQECYTYALELATYDQTRVNLQQCHRFNTWFQQARQYSQLQVPLQAIQNARPIARWQILALAIVAGVILFLALGTRLPRLSNAIFFSSYFFFLILLYFVPERLYGTTIEQIEGKVLRVVDALEKMLMAGEMEFTEAAFFQVKENLQNARRELRQQIDLAHRRWR